VISATTPADPIPVPNGCCWILSKFCPQPLVPAWKLLDDKSVSLTLLAMNKKTVNPIGRPMSSNRYRFNPRYSMPPASPSHATGTNAERIPSR
jgi:hypothetical protein